MKSSTNFSIVAQSKLFPSLKWFLTHHMQLFCIANVLRKVISHSVTWRQAQGCKILYLGYFKPYYDISKGDRIIGEKRQWSEFRPKWAFITSFSLMEIWKDWQHENFCEIWIAGQNGVVFPLIKHAMESCHPGVRTVWEQQVQTLWLVCGSFTKKFKSREPCHYKKDNVFWVASVLSLNTTTNFHVTKNAVSCS